MNYHYMRIVFGAGVATGKFAMGSNEPLGHPVDHETIDLENMTAEPCKEAGTSNKRGKHVDHHGKVEDTQGAKRRGLNEDDVALLTGMTTAVVGLSAAISEGNHAEAAPGIYEAVMGCSNYARSDLMVCLNYLMANKGTALVFVGMKEDDKDLWIETHLAKIRGQMAFQ
jgi:hypothetical protein